MNRWWNPFWSLVVGLVAYGTFGGLLWAQSEADRPVGEVTAGMLRQQSGRSRAGGLPLNVVPTPQETYWHKGVLDLGPVEAVGLAVETPSGREDLRLLESELDKRLARRWGARRSDKPGKARVVFSIGAAGLPVATESVAKQLGTLRDRKEAYVLKCVSTSDGDAILIAGNSEASLWNGLVTLVQMMAVEKGHLVLPKVEIVDYPHFDRRGLIVDIGGQGFMIGPSRWSLERWKRFVDWMVDHKMNEIWFEIIGSGRLMGNLDVDKGEWIGFPVDLKSYPQLVCRDRPIRRWDEKSGRIVDDTYTAPNVKQDFLRELIDYGKARGIRCSLLIGYDYFANQLPVVLGVPANDPMHPGANRIYDTLLKEIVSRYSNASGVILITIENKHVPPEMVDRVAQRVRHAKSIIREINPEMEVGILNDYLEWRPRAEVERFAELIRGHAYQVYAPHTQPQNKSWRRLFGSGIVRYELFSQYAWDHITYVFPDRVKRELMDAYVNGYRRVVSQCWTWDVTSLNYTTMAQNAWNLSGLPDDTFWDATLGRTFGERAKKHMKTALAHTRFDVRFDIVARMIRRNAIFRPFRFWDMYNLTIVDGLKDSMLAELEDDARQSLKAAQAALPLVSNEEARRLVEFVITSAERRLYLATSARHMLKARLLMRKGKRKKAEALAELELAIREGEKMIRAATKLGIEFPMAVQDDDVVAVYRALKARVEGW